MITVFTPSYNRVNTIDRVWNSLLIQTFTDFEWVVIDDGSSDKIEQKIESYQGVSEFPIVFHKFKENRGKHIATNKALELARRTFFIVADSDDAFTEDALQFFIDGWNSLSETEKKHYCGIRACTVDQNGIRYSDMLPYEPLDASMTEAFYKHKFRKESWCMVRTDLHRQFLFPDDHKDHFYPEGIIWSKMSANHPLRFYNRATRVYYTDIDTPTLSLVNDPYKKIIRNLTLPTYVLNNEIKNFRYYPTYILKMTLVYATYSRFANLSIYKSISELQPLVSKAIYLLMVVPGYVVYRYLKYKFERG